ncbi:TRANSCRIPTION ELONGATION FACTOR (TFIIS) FAMILY PROTEIN-RELATED [Salix koriyanagi]|uniref:TRANSCRIPTION ELONGATION FACTOR (TFIIS) FAMILY PROTEIN-RELATED n=1 Tax=Salix koriyanagi TaxID=2511006 RepID=A0A9Q0QL16_9ROSI|nr:TRANSCRIPTION ELONGATION FACTOR (TFIIS) FAMILY PROTEIN-RELATED [Salix koriyanagi]
MTLEDFFTLTEMKDGLTAPSRVHELVAVMQKEKPSVLNNVGDSTRQWAAVASTIAATENKDCLDLFVNLDGLLFIDRWLNIAQKFSNETSEGSAEESITAFLRALEKLQIDKERSISSGVWGTVNNLLNHNSSRVQDRARALFDSWKLGEVSDAIRHDVQSVGASDDVRMNGSETGKTECVVVKVPLSNGSADVENNTDERTGDESLQSRNSNCLQEESVQDVQIQTNDCDDLILDHRNLEDRMQVPLTAAVDRSLDPLTTAVVSKSDQESLSLKEKHQESSAVEETVSTEPDSEAPKMLTDKSAASSKVEPGAISLSHVAVIAKEIVPESDLQNNVDGKEDNCCTSTSASSDVAIPVSTSKVGTDEAENRNQCQTPTLAEDGDFSPDPPHHLSDNKITLEKLDNSGTLFSRMEDGASDDDRKHSSDEAVDNSDFSKPTTDKCSPDLIGRRRSGIELEYGIVDALEVARQVAQEVEREVVDYREQSCSSSSDKILDSGIKQPGSPDSINGEQDLSAEIPPENVPARQNQSSETCAEQEGRLIDSSNLENEAENGMHDLESSQVTQVAQEPEVNAEKCPCDFDLNEEICSDDMVLPMNTSPALISIVSASRAAAASGSPAAPLQFEGTLGWRGSAATSAFRPASPRKTADGDKTVEAVVSSSCSKQRQVCLDIDLNVTEGGEEKVVDFILSRQIPVSSGFHSGESSLEMGSRRPERPNLDLNRTSDDGDAFLTDLRIQGRPFYPQNGHRSPSPASSSSSMQPSLRNFDLNDRPFFHNDSLDQGLYHSKSSQTGSVYGGFKPGDPVFSIMGTKVEVSNRTEVDKKDFIQQAPSLPNSNKPLEPVMGSNLTRMGGVYGMIPALSYTHSPVFGYSALPTAPTMSIPSAMYGSTGSIPYMVDSRGAPVMPQIMGSAPSVPPYSQQPFMMSMSGAPLGLNGAGPSRPSLDLNSGFAMEGGSTGGLRQLFMPGQGNSQPSSSSGVGGKRKEPDRGWEPAHSLQHKHPQPPWR